MTGYCAAELLEVLGHPSAGSSQTSLFEAGKLLALPSGQSLPSTKKKKGFRG